MKWFVEKDGKQHGPYSGSQLRDLAASGRLLKTDLVRREDQQASVPAERVKGLFAEAPIPAPVPPVTSPPELPAEEPTASATDTKAEATKESDGPGSAGTDSWSWFVLQNNLQYGPFSFDQLRDMARTGQLFVHDYVRNHHAKDWAPLTAFPILMMDLNSSTQNSAQRANSVVLFQKVLSGIAAVLVVWFALFLIGSVFDNSEKHLRDFGDNTANYKGKTMTFNLNYDGTGLGGWIEHGVMAQSVNAPFRGSGFVGGNWFNFDMHILIPSGAKVPPLRSSESVLVTFQCSEGDLHDGNVAKKIVRP